MARKPERKPDDPDQGQCQRHMEFRVPEIFLGVLLAVAVFALGMVFAASYDFCRSNQYLAERPETAEQHKSSRNFPASDGSEGGQRHEQQEPKSEFWSAKLSDWALVGFTALLVLFTFRLWKSTEKLWIAGEKQIGVAREAAEAAKLNADALISAERAQLFVIVEHNNLLDALRGPRFYRATESVRETEMRDAQISPRPELEFVIRNTGRTAAILQDVSYQLIQADTEIPMWQYSYQDTIVNAVIEGGKETSPATPCVIENNLTVADGFAIIDGASALLLWVCYFPRYLQTPTSVFLAA